MEDERTVHYYVWQRPDGSVYAWKATTQPSYDRLSREVTKEEYVELGGNPDYVYIPSPPQPSPEEVAMKERDAKIKALIDRNDFLEECLVEMADVVYNSNIANT